MSVRFYDWVYIIDCGSSSNVAFLKDKLDNRSLLQRRADRERFRRNKIDAYSEKLDEVILNKLKIVNEQEHCLNKLWQMFGISSLPEDKQSIFRIVKFFELYELIKNINPYKKKEINKDYFLRALDVLKSFDT